VLENRERDKPASKNNNLKQNKRMCNIRKAANVWLTALAAFSLSSTTAVMACDVSNTIVNQHWTTNCSPYRVVGDILVAGLTIDPGVTVQFAGNYNFEVAGKLKALGTERQPISFMRTSGGWQGIYFNNAQAGSQLSYCVISGALNSAIRLVATPAPTIVHCSFIGNSTSDQGGAINAPAQTGDLVFDGCTFQNNSSATHGGAVRANMNSGVLRVLNGCQFISNVANPSQTAGDYVGGALYVVGNAEISDTVFTNNTSVSRCSSSFGCTVTGRAGAVWLQGGNAVIRDCLFVHNTVRGINGGDCFFGGASRAWGGGIFLYDGTLKLRNSILSSNVTDASSCGPSPSGGGLFVNSGTCSVVNVTCAYNTDYATDSGINVVSGATAGITNSIVYFNGGSQIGGAPTVAYSDVQGGFAGSGNISNNPIFLSTRDLIIVPGSPCIDKGSTNAVYNDVCFPPSLGNTPSTKARNDMGAHGGPGAYARFLLRLEQPFKLELFGCVPGHTYLIQATTNVSASASDWQTVQQIANVHVGDVVYFRETSTNTLPCRFYKLNLAP
jgi:predicted outer membrane repeat protein